jgi:hypothetical protein
LGWGPGLTASGARVSAMAQLLINTTGFSFGRFFAVSLAGIEFFS